MKIMNKAFFALAALALAFACTPEAKTPDESGDGDKDKTVHVTGISLDRTSATIKEGESITLVATVTPDNAENKAVVWSSSSDAVATVDNTGKVSGVRAGSATITATAEDGGMKATCALSVEANMAPSVTVEANHISAVSAVLAGKANLGSTVAADLQVGFQYSKSAGILPSNSTTIEATDADASYNYTASITGLEPDTKYYFRSFVRQNSQYTYGEVKEFTTKDVASVLETKEASGVEAAKATLNAKLDLTDVQHSSLSYGFFWGTSDSALNTDYKCTEIKDNAIAAELTGLSHKTQYWYKAYVKLDSRTLYGEVKTFTTAVVPVKSISLDKREYTFNSIGSTLTLKATVLPADATDPSLEWSSDNESVATVDTKGNVISVSDGTAIIKAEASDGSGKFATCSITIESFVFGAIDLGLPSGLKWANANLGASQPEDYGDYYAWGMVYTLKNYKWSNYIWGCYADPPIYVNDLVIIEQVKKYCPVENTTYWGGKGSPDGKTILDPEDDVAHVKLGGSWRMPTDEEWTELMTKCTWARSTRNGVVGRKVTGPNGNSIFLPGAGSRSYDLILGNSAGGYWSSSLGTGVPNKAWSLYFSYDSAFSPNPSGGTRSRCDGLTVRPVTE